MRESFLPICWKTVWIACYFRELLKILCVKSARVYRVHKSLQNSSIATRLHLKCCVIVVAWNVIKTCSINPFMNIYVKGTLMSMIR